MTTENVVMPDLNENAAALLPMQEREVTRIIEADCELILRKDASYGSSWKRRGGVGAYMVTVRKLDRLEHQISASGGLTPALMAARAQGTDSVREDLQDLRCYMLLILTELLPDAQHHSLEIRLAVVTTQIVVPSLRSWAALWIDELRPLDEFGRQALSRWSEIERACSHMGYNVFAVLRETSRAANEWQVVLGLLYLLELRLIRAQGAPWTEPAESNGVERDNVAGEEAGPSYVNQG